MPKERRKRANTVSVGYFYMTDRLTHGSIVIRTRGPDKVKICLLYLANLMARNSTVSAAIFVNFFASQGPLSFSRYPSINPNPSLPPDATFFPPSLFPLWPSEQLRFCRYDIGEATGRSIEQHQRPPARPPVWCPPPPSVQLRKWAVAAPWLNWRSLLKPI